MSHLQDQPGELLDAIIDGVHTSVDQTLDTDPGALPVELDCCIEMISAIFSGLLIRALMNPSLKREALVAALRPVLRTTLTPST